jgi:hypothetical protein
MALCIGTAVDAGYSGGTGEPVVVEQTKKTSGKISQNRGLELYSGYYQKNDGQVEVYYDTIEDGKLVGGKVLLALPPVLEYQSITQAAPLWNYETVINNGPSGNRIDIVVVGDGYTQSELTKYQIHVNNILSGYFAQEPLASYINFFNVHRVDVISNESGVDESDYNIYRDTALDMEYNCGGTARLLCVNTAKAWNAASVAPDADQILALANSTRYGGAGYSDLATMAGDNSWSVELALHEFGHSFGKLADEYGGSETYTGPEPSQINISIYNAQQQTDLQRKWYRWLDLPNVDTYEGAYYCDYGIYRPTDNSKMRSLNRPFGEVNVEQFIFKIYENVSIIDDYTPLSDEPVTSYTDFYVVPVEPTPNTIDIQWYIDGQPVSGANAKTFSADIPELSRGLHEVSVKVTDNTSKVRNETKRNQLMTKTLKWQIWVGVKYSGGTGTPEDPYRITTPEDMQQIGTNPGDWDKHFILINDINLAEYTSTQFNRIGTDWDSAFTGVFDGNEKRIWNFTWTSQDTSSLYIGLFGYVGAHGQIENLGLENASVNVVKAESVGSLVGENLGTITNCYSTGGVAGRWGVGGLVGYNYQGTIVNCYSTDIVSGEGDIGSLVGGNDGMIARCYSTGDVSGNWDVGGLAGCNWGTIIDSYSAGSISGDDCIGGLVGWNNGTITYCYSRGAVSGNYEVGGMVGTSYEQGVTVSFWDVNTSGQAQSAGGTPETTAEMQAKSTFTDVGWDFMNIWDICEGTNYPRFIWQIPLGDFACPDGVDFLDFAVLVSAWHTDPNDTGWNPACDISKPRDNFINEFDLAVLCENWLKEK